MRTGGNADPRRALPALDAVLRVDLLRRAEDRFGHRAVVAATREALAEWRGRLAERADSPPPTSDDLAREVERRLSRRLGRGLRRVLNATGIFLHTNLGRAPLPPEVAAEVAALESGACDLEMDLDSGERGERNRRVGELVGALVSAEAALVCNNNAASLLLALTALASGREVVVSRGELIEIGGSFRIPDILAASGARLREVGTTNRTRIADYAAAIGPGTALLLKVHPSNYRIRGFTEAVPARSLAELAGRHDLPLLVDQGSGLPRPHQAAALREEPSLRGLIEDGVDLVTASGDKLLGGPQAGLVIGRDTLVARCRKHPLYRALRPGRTTYAALEAVLRRHLAGEPFPLERLWPDPDEHRDRLEPLAARLGAAVTPAEAFVGGGSAPDEAIPGEALTLEGGERLASELRRGEPPVVGYMRDDRVVLDLRTVDPADDEALAAAVERARERLR